MTDPISDLLIRLKNAAMAGHEVVRLPYSKMKAEIAAILLEEGYLTAVEKVDGEPLATLQVGLKYVGRSPAMSDVKLLSKPGRRLYTSVKDIPRTLGGYGVTIVSTNKGVLSDKSARQQNVGGELICQIW
ncbi:30S ribosomal protein S8 [Candidatus Woesebacteria bacterium]|nr:30S ribosomal protein S8 [Candidatus Woesebacteria bacterium]